MEAVEVGLKAAVALRPSPQSGARSHSYIVLLTGGGAGQEQLQPTGAFVDCNTFAECLPDILCNKNFLLCLNKLKHADGVSQHECLHHSLDDSWLKTDLVASKSSLPFLCPKQD